MQEYLGYSQAKYIGIDALRGSTVGLKGLFGCDGWKITNSSMDSRKTRRRFHSMDLATTHGGRGFPTEQAQGLGTPLANAKTST